MASERATLSEFLELYRDHPCLWDFNSDDYKDKTKKTQAWELLVDKLKVLKPGADIKDAKKRIENMRTAYKREAKKVKVSKRTGSRGSDVYVPNLWYYKLLTFLESKDEQCKTEMDPLASDEESQNSEQSSDESYKKKTRYNDRTVEKREEKLIEQSKIQPLNSFSIYVSEQLKQVNTFQRQVAEKLIAEVLFLAKTGNLNYDSKVETPSRSTIIQVSHSCHHPSSSPPTSQTTPTTQIQRNTNSPPSTEVIEPPIPSPTDQTSNTVHKASLLKEYLIIKKL